MRWHTLTSTLFVALLFVAACTPTSVQRGNFIENYQIELVEVGTHSRSDLLRILGSPTIESPFDPHMWYYLGQKTEKHGVFDPNVIDERVLIVRFDPETGTVASIQEDNSERIAVPITDEITPTYGNEVTIFQQFFGNVGRFNPNTE